MKRNYGTWLGVALVFVVIVAGLLFISQKPASGAGSIIAQQPTVSPSATVLPSPTVAPLYGMPVAETTGAPLGS